MVAGFSYKPETLDGVAREAPASPRALGSIVLDVPYNGSSPTAHVATANTITKPTIPSV